MAIHGLKLDYEAAILFIAAIVISVFATGRPISQILFTALIVILFFMKGLNLRPDKVRENTHKWREVLVGNAINYLIFPLAAITFSQYLSGSARYAVLAIGFSAAAVGPAVIWSGRAKADSGTASILSVAGILPALPLLWFSLEPIFGIDPLIFMENVFYYAFLPFLVGMFSRNIETFLLDDMKHHFSRVALWLVMLTAFIQFQALVAVKGALVAFPIAIVFASFILLTAVMSYLGYSFSRHVGIMERKSRSVSLFSGSKSFAVALLIASQLSSMTLMYVLTYFFARHMVMEMIVKQSNSDLLFQNIDRDRLKHRLF